MNMFQIRFPLNCSTTPGSCNMRYAYDSLRTSYVSKLSMFYERDLGTAEERLGRTETVEAKADSNVYL